MGGFAVYGQEAVDESAEHFEVGFDDEEVLVGGVVEREDLMEDLELKETLWLGLGEVFVIGNQNLYK